MRTTKDGYKVLCNDRYKLNLFGIYDRCCIRRPKGTRSPVPRSKSEVQKWIGNGLKNLPSGGIIPFVLIYTIMDQSVSKNILEDHIEDLWEHIVRKPGKSNHYSIVKVPRDLQSEMGKNTKIHHRKPC